MREADAKHDAYINLMSAIAKQIGGLEIKLRVKQLRHKLCGLMNTIALSRAIILEVNNGNKLPPDTKLNRKELTDKITFDVLTDAPPGVAKAVGVDDNGAGLAANFATVNSFNNQDIENKVSEVDSEIMKPIITAMNTWLPRLSVDLWKHDDEKDTQREINAALRQALQPKAMLTANDEVVEAMDAEDANNPSQSLINVIRKEQKRLGDKQMALLKRQMRKNYSGDGKDDQSSRPTKNGRERKGSSKAKNGNSKKNNKGASNKKKEDGTDEPNKSNHRPSKKKQNGSQAGSGKGGKGKSAKGR